MAPGDQLKPPPTIAEAGAQAAPNAPTEAPADQKLGDLSGAISGDLAEDPQKKSPEEQPLPDNEFSRMYYELKKDIDENSDWQPAGNIILILLKLGALGKTFLTDHISGVFMSNLDKDDTLKEEKFNEEEATKLLSKVLNEPTEPPEDFKKLAASVASTRYACNILGVRSSDDPKILASRLKHLQKPIVEGKDPESAYKSNVGLETLRQNGIPKGTVLFVSPFPKDLNDKDLKTLGTKFQNVNTLVFVGIGDNQFGGYNPDTGKKKIYKLGDADCPLNKFYELTACFLPNEEKTE